MKGTEQDKVFRDLFYGEKESVLKCTNIDYESSTKESFSKLDIHLQQSSTIEDALKKLFEAEELSGENAYNHEIEGKQDAKKFLRIIKLPPVL